MQDYLKIGELEIRPPSGRNYWNIRGKIPLKFAKEMYYSKYGRDIRANCHGIRLKPEEWHIEYFNKDGIQVLDRTEEQEALKFSKLEVKSAREAGETVLKTYVFSDDPTTEEPFITSYHIDSEEALSYFVDEWIKAYMK